MHPLLNRNLLCGLLIFLQQITFAQAPDLVLYNGKIFTATGPNHFVKAVAIRGNRIQATGTDASVRRLCRRDTKQIDLQGKTVVPGFNDAHYHHQPKKNGYTISFREPGVSAWQECRDSLLAATKRLPPDTWIFGNIDIAIATDSSINRYRLDSISTNNPIWLTAYWGHGSILNSAALKALGIGLQQRDPVGGLMERTRDTEIINGRLQEEAQLFGQALPFIDDKGAINSLKELASTASRFGITTIQNMCTAAPPEAYGRWLPASEFPIRMRLIRWGKLNDDKYSRSSNNEALEKWLTGSLYYLGGTKWMLDGTPLERGAATQMEYADKRFWKGSLNYDNFSIANMINWGAEGNKPLHFHAVGDRCIAVLLQEIDKVANSGTKLSRLRIEHGDGIQPAMYAAIKKHGIMVVQNPAHLMTDSVMRVRWTSKMLTTAFPLKSLLKAGIPLALGSDGPLNPFLNIYFACTHATRPQEALSREEAVIAYTRTAAQAEGKEAIKGTLQAGKLADLTVLSQDIFTIPLTALPATYSVLTLVDGKIIHVSY